ncbi:hypothetical protein BDF21DRAFT_468488 [Thamnidium elegans]|uniref:Uncharacterized protein n=1 Tax=Thamnidium elegans TaxID=101142 RepID=A0A8H7VXI7_9FUNG|nr:hypothetical protein INT48_008755 [Thamnidium elegans]KAI8052768.1 hypothetical protein BDF21DRAFT_468488 [Thamnidium elegans]
MPKYFPMIWWCTRNFPKLALVDVNDERTPSNLYYSAQTEWADGSKSDVLYVPKTEVTNASPPILIEIQNRVVKGFSSIFFEEQFNTNINCMHLLEMKCKRWAKSCDFISPKSIKDHIKENPMNPLVALAYYMTCQSQCLESLTYNTEVALRYYKQGGHEEKGKN